MSDDVWEQADAVEVPADYEPEPEGVPADAPAPQPGAMRAVLAADAKQRASRSGFQSALVLAIAAVCGVTATYLENGDVSHLDWKALGMAAVVAGAQPIAAYVQRMLGK